jgi:tyrosyl-tRNA synthetase
MSAYNSEFLTILEERGFIQQISQPAEVLDALADRGPITAYIGFDCTAPSLHVGSLLPIMMLHWFQYCGHRPIALMGGGTTRVGDPSGKDESRRILTNEMIDDNLQGIRRIFSHFLVLENFTSDVNNELHHHILRQRPFTSPAIMANNADWLDNLNYIDFLRDVGSHFSVNRMLAFDSVKTRLNRKQELSFLEFNYMVLQAYDFVALNKQYDCVLQMGGSDQWGNIVSGIELGRRLRTTQMFALTAPLITTSSGAKMGKTAAGAIWLDPNLLSSYDYWQFWRNTEDGDVRRFLKLFTILPVPKIDELTAQRGQELNEAKRILATEATALVHGRAAAIRAEATARGTFENEEGALGLPSVDVPLKDIENGVGVLNAFVAAGLATSTGEVRRAIANNSISVNDGRISSVEYVISSKDLTSDGIVKLSFGRKKHVLIKPV